MLDFENWYEQNILLSLMIFYEMPKHRLIYSLMELPIATPIAFLSGISSSHLLNYLVAAKTQMYSFKGEWIGSMRLNPQVWNTLDFTLLDGQKQFEISWKGSLGLIT